ncbi:hypothetical protein Trydic_g20976 [Trypoxylus dichotomus]
MDHLNAGWIDDDRPEESESLSALRQLAQYVLHCQSNVHVARIATVRLPVCRSSLIDSAGLGASVGLAMLRRFFLYDEGAAAKEQVTYRLRNLTHIDEKFILPKRRYTNKYYTPIVAKQSLQTLTHIDAMPILPRHGQRRRYLLISPLSGIIFVWVRAKHVAGVARVDTYKRYQNYRVFTSSFRRLLQLMRLIRGWPYTGDTVGH